MCLLCFYCGTNEGLCHRVDRELAWKMAAVHKLQCSSASVAWDAPDLHVAISMLIGLISPWDHTSTVALKGSVSLWLNNSHELAQWKGHHTIQSISVVFFLKRVLCWLLLIRNVFESLKVMLCYCRHSGKNLASLPDAKRAFASCVLSRWDGRLNF